MMQLVGMRQTYTQEPDSCGPVDSLLNELSVEVTDAGGGPYLVIETERWAFGDAAEIDAWAERLKSALAQVEETAWASRVRASRDRMGWTQTRLAAHLGVTQATVSQWESGRSAPGEQARRAIERMEDDATPPPRDSRDEA